MKKQRMLAVGLVVAALALGVGRAAALTAESGGTATLLFDTGDVAAMSEWSDLNVVGLRGGMNGSNVGSPEVAMDSGGSVYAVVRGYDDYNDLTWYDGVVRTALDGPGLETIDRIAWDWEDVSGTGWVSYGDIRAIAVASVRVPSTGALEERLVVVRTGEDLAGTRFLEAFGYELTATSDGSYDAESLFTWDTVDGSFSLHIAVDTSDGTVFVLQGMPGTTETDDGSIRAFEWGGSVYAERSQRVTSAQVGYRDLVVHNGYLYTFDLAGRGSSTSSDPILQVDPDGSDVTSDYADMRQEAAEGSYYGWTSAGTALYIAEWTSQRRRGRTTRSGEITTIVGGQTTSSSNRIATFGADRLYGMAGSSDGTFAIVMERDDTVGVYALAPGTDSGGGDSGDTGGGGNGKGKKK